MSCEKNCYLHIHLLAYTTLPFYGIGKRTGLNCFAKNQDFENITNVFLGPKATQSSRESR